MRPDTVVHRPERGLYITGGCYGRGVALLSQIGRLLAEIVSGSLDASAGPIPVSPISPLPFHGIRLRMCTTCWRLTPIGQRKPMSRDIGTGRYPCRAAVLGVSEDCFQRADAAWPSDHA
jgi:hypothetical protein